MAKTDKERLATSFWNRVESDQATDCNSLVETGATWILHLGVSDLVGHEKLRDFPRSLLSLRRISRI